jgi:hypothetical protein
MPFKPVAKAPTEEEVLNARRAIFKGKDPTIKELMEKDCAPKTSRALKFFLDSRRMNIHSEKVALSNALLDAMRDDFNNI